MYLNSKSKNCGCLFWNPPKRDRMRAYRKVKFYSFYLSAGVAKQAVRTGLKILWSRDRVGSSPTAGTIKKIINWCNA